MKATSTAAEQVRTEVAREAATARARKPEANAWSKFLDVVTPVANPNRVRFA